MLSECLQYSRLLASVATLTPEQAPLFWLGCNSGKLRMTAVLQRVGPPGCPIQTPACPTWFTGGLLPGKCVHRIASFVLLVIAAGVVTAEELPRGRGGKWPCPFFGCLPPSVPRLAPSAQRQRGQEGSRIRNANAACLPLLAKRPPGGGGEL